MLHVWRHLVSAGLVHLLEDKKRQNVNVHLLEDKKRQNVNVHLLENKKRQHVSFRQMFICWPHCNILEFQCKVITLFRSTKKENKCEFSVTMMILKPFNRILYFGYSKIAAILWAYRSFFFMWKWVQIFEYTMWNRPASAGIVCFPFAKRYLE